MATKSEILNNLREYTADEITEAIKAGIITMYELSKSGNLTPMMRRRIEERLAANSAEVPQSISEVDSTAVNEVPSSDKENYQLEENIEIPEEVDKDIPSEVTIPEAPVYTAGVTPSFESNTQTVTSNNALEEKSNKGMFKRPFSFNGRIRRTEYWISIIIYCAWDVITNVLMDTPDPSLGASVFVLVSFIPIIWFLWAQGAKRCHDRGNSGWYQIIPFYGFVLLFGGSDEGSNKYGDNPKE